ncbi:MAG: hypothetical protein Q9181_004015 [Wetmoreana brouardii]
MPLRANLSAFHSPCTVLPLRLTESLFQKFLFRYQIDPSLLPVLFATGEAPHPAERGGSHFASSYSQQPRKMKISDLQYCAYDLQYIEENKRSKENPWSTRHIGIYHHWDPVSDFNLWVLLCPNADGPVQRILGALQHADRKTLQHFCDDPFRFHRLLNDEDEAFTLDVTPSTSTLNFEAIRCLRHLDNTLLSAHAVCNNILSISHSLRSLDTNHDESAFYNQQTQELRGYLQGIANLRGKISNSIALLTHGLDLKNGQTAAALNEHLLHLTGNTVDDSMTMKIITVVGLIYLPADLVATVYGMNVLPFDSERQKLTVAKGFWTFVATWLPLTAITIAIYIAVLWYYRRAARQKSGHWARKEAEEV